MDRIDIQLWMSPVDPKKLVDKVKSESSAAVAARVKRAREIQRKRFAEYYEVSGHEGPSAGEGMGYSSRAFCNAAMSNRQIDVLCPLNPECKELLQRIIERMGLSARACSRIIKLARTIADLEESPDILPGHLAEAAGYRSLDKQNIFG